jgi:hypothetical protein
LPGEVVKPTITLEVQSASRIPLLDITSVKQLLLVGKTRSSMVEPLRIIAVN